MKAALDGLGLPADKVARCKRCACELPGEAPTALAKLRAYLQETLAGGGGGGGGGAAVSAATAAAGGAAGRGGAVGPGSSSLTSMGSLGTGSSSRGATPLSSMGSGGAGGGGSGGGGLPPRPYSHVPLPPALASALEEVAVVVQLLEQWGIPAKEVRGQGLAAPWRRAFAIHSQHGVI